MMLLATAVADQRRPNVLFLMVDDLNDYISLLDKYPGIKTPNLDKFSRTSTVFTKAYCNGVACLPSRTSLLSGLPPYKTGCYQNRQPVRLPKGTVQLPSHFMQHGYIVKGTGKIFHGGKKFEKHWHEFAGKRSYSPLPSPRHIPADFGLPKLWDYGVVEDESKFSDFQNTQIAIKWLQRTYDRPFFIALGLYAPHNPWTAPKRFFDMYPKGTFEVFPHPKNDLDDLPSAGVLMAETTNQEWKPKVIKKLMSSHHWKENIRAYLACISYMDHNLGRVLTALENSPHRDNTIVCLMSDHGYHWGEKKHLGKFALWEQTTRILFAWRVPDITPQGGSICKKTVSLEDVYPTLVDLCGISKPSQHILWDGKSIKDLLVDKESAWNRPVVSTFGYNNHAVRDDQWRYIRYKNGDEELYDMNKDPHEWVNLANQRDFDAVKQRLKLLLPKNSKPVYRKER